MQLCSSAVVFLVLFSVNAAKRSLMRESEDGVRLETEKNELEFRLTQLQETHKYCYCLLHILIHTHTHSLSLFLSLSLSLSLTLSLSLSFSRVNVQLFKEEITDYREKLDYENKIR